MIPPQVEFLHSKSVVKKKVLLARINKVSKVHALILRKKRKLLFKSNDCQGVGPSNESIFGDWQMINGKKTIKDNVLQHKFVVNFLLFFGEILDNQMGTADVTGAPRHFISL